jgi:hypothetical protein
MTNNEFTTNCKAIDAMPVSSEKVALLLSLNAKADEIKRTLRQAIDRANQKRLD